MASGEMSSRATYLKTSGDITLITVDMTLGEMTFGRLDRLPSVLIKSLLTAFNKKTKCSCRVMKTISNDFHKNVLVIFAGISLKLEKLAPNFFKFLSMCIHVICCNRRQETVSIPKYNS